MFRFRVDEKSMSADIHLEADVKTRGTVYHNRDNGRITAFLEAWQDEDKTGTRRQICLYFPTLGDIESLRDDLDDMAKQYKKPPKQIE